MFLQFDFPYGTPAITGSPIITIGQGSNEPELLLGISAYDGLLRKAIGTAVIIGVDRRSELFVGISCSTSEIPPSSCYSCRSD